MSSTSTPIVAPLIPDAEDQANEPMPDSQRAEEREAERNERLIEGDLDDPLERTHDGRRSTGS